MRLLVCGGRDFEDQARLNRVLAELHLRHNITCIIHGGARGADMLAGTWAICSHIQYEVYHADWKRYGRAAGHMRNTEMLVRGRPDAVLAFPGGRGTANMVAQAKRAGIRVWKVQADGKWSIDSHGSAESGGSR